ncbi:endo alpha-1,4 polygalactosaminidase [Robbsia andropogonis]|uniref:endo alpha-1,4 polygalactosaminidase n=1 Tax=Robbsia andropogonis TaxID=28092 RepID=UPI001F167BBD|nr:endo alpha-1,4 polygalactosaminidase [Robbsia andropogonis]MCP1116537.1 endo alpha-1,4 polygalactosaminidase [Robbsia andropogonis]MCP1126784.1 endo alpha-1,4 polygalactosaminidase [Robbsia andropogonis]
MKPRDTVSTPTGTRWRAAIVTWIAACTTLMVTACGGGSNNTDNDTSANSATSSNAALPGTLSATVAGSPWLSYYGQASTMGSLATVAATFHIMDLDLDPDLANFSTTDVATLKNGGTNLVLSYLNVGSCESFRSYWSTNPSGFIGCGNNTAAQIGPYSGYANETWMNPSNTDYQNLIVNYVAPRLVAQGADGFFLDNMEIVEHGTATQNGPCDATCAQGGLDLVRKLREKYPSLVIVMQNATSTTTRLGTTGGVSFASLLDGVSHESVYAPSYDASAESQLLAWQAMQLTPRGHPFWIATLDYVGSCSQTASAQTDYARSRAKGFVPYASDKSSGLNVVCYWGF